MASGVIVNSHEKRVFKNGKVCDRDLMEIYYFDLKGASFDGATINGANFKGAKIILEDLKKGQLSEVILPDGKIWE